MVVHIHKCFQKEKSLNIFVPIFVVSTFDKTVPISGDIGEAGKLTAAMRRYSIAAAEAQSVTRIAENRQTTTAALMNDSTEDKIREKMSFQTNKFHWWSWVTVFLITTHFVTTVYMAAFQVSST